MWGIRWKSKWGKVGEEMKRQGQRMVDESFIMIFNGNVLIDFHGGLHLVRGGWAVVLLAQSILHPFISTLMYWAVKQIPLLTSHAHYLLSLLVSNTPDLLLTYKSGFFSFAFWVNRRCLSSPSPSSQPLPPLSICEFTAICQNNAGVVSIHAQPSAFLAHSYSSPLIRWHSERASSSSGDHACTAPHAVLPLLLLVSLWNHSLPFSFSKNNTDN